MIEQIKRKISVLILFIERVSRDVSSAYWFTSITIVNRSSRRAISYHNFSHFALFLLLLISICWNYERKKNDVFKCLYTSRYHGRRMFAKQ